MDGSRIRSTQGHARRAALIGVLAPPSIPHHAGGPPDMPADAETSTGRIQRGRGQMTKLWCTIAVGAALAAGAAQPAAAKLNSCDGPIVLGTTISVTGIFSSLAGSWDKMTE